MTDVTAPGSGQKIRPLSAAQRRLWLLDRLEPGIADYTIGRVIRMRGALSHPALQDSLRAIVARHEALRTTFVEVDGEPRQVITARRPVELPIIDLSTLIEGERAAEVMRLVREEAQRSFDLARGPLMRTSLLRQHADDHVLLLFMHHIVTDAWSMSVLFDELGRLYEAFSRGHPPELPALPLHFSDVCGWADDPGNAAALDRDVAYWRTHLAGADPVLELPTDRPRPSARTGRGATLHRVFPIALRDRLNAASRDAQATLFMTLLGAFTTLLHRYTERDDILVGTPIAGRNDVELEPLVGFFVNTLVMRSDLSGDPTFRELLGRLREVTLNAYDHGRVPFERLIADLRVPRSLSHTPVFQVMFILQNAPKQHLELAGLSLEELDVELGISKFDLTVDMAEVDAGLSCTIEYSTDLFEPSTMTRMLGHFHSLLEGIAADPGQRLSVLPLMDESERRHVLTTWNDTVADYPREQCIHQLFTAQARSTPDAVALISGGARLTYQELDARANRVAHELRARRVERGSLVAICLERSLEAVVGLLGILKTGAAYVPLDPAYPTSRLAFMLRDSAAPVLLTARRLRDRLPACSADIVDLDTDWDTIERQPATDPAVEVHAGDVAYVIYTSGSTGTPKGVLATHRASVNRFAWMWRRWRFTPADVCCQKTPLSFVDSVWEVFGPLLQGVPSVIVPDDVVGDSARLVELLATHRVSRIVLVPSLLRVLLDDVPDMGQRLPDLTFWITSGEAITSALSRRFEQVRPDAILTNLYGSSEVGADVTEYVVTAGRWRDRVPIGRPIANTRVYVLDRHANPVPVGIPGEIYVGGDGLARGYLHDEEQTARKFVRDPFSADRQARLYRTGDRGRFLPDGNLEFLGRIDDQVKIRGIRIELGEIENVLRAYPGVTAAVAAIAEDGADARLVGYVVAATAPPEPGDIRRFIRERLPEYLVPAAFVNIDAIPMTPSGKVDRRALLALGSTRATPAYVGPRNPTEQALAAIMAEVLKLERVSIHDDFFELGGHSLLAVQIIARVRKVLRVDLPIRSLFNEPTVAGLASEVDRAPVCDASPVIASTNPSVSNREALLARLAGLSDADVEALLGKLEVPESEERETETF